MSKKPYCIELGNLIYEARKKAHLTQEELEEISGIPSRQLSRYENGSAEPRAIVLLKIAKALNVSVDELVPGDLRCIGECEEQDDFKIKLIDLRKSVDVLFEKTIKIL